MRKQKIILLLALSILIAAGVFLWPRMRPRMLLAAAIEDSLYKLEARLCRHPLQALLEFYDPEGRYTANIEAEGKNPLAGTIRYDMALQSDLRHHQVSGKGTVGTEKQLLDVSLYFDDQFMAISSEKLSNGVFYGITYDSFRSDLQSVPLLNYIVSDALLAQWEASVQQIQQGTVKSPPQIRLPQFSWEEIRQRMPGIAALPCSIDRTRILLDEVPFDCDKLSYQFAGEDASSMLSELSGSTIQSSSFTISFYLYQDILMRVSFAGEAESTAFHYSLDLSSDPENTPLTLRGCIGQTDAFTVTVTTEDTPEHYAECWDILITKNGAEYDHSFAFDQNPSDGVINLRSKKLSAPLRLSVTKEETGLKLETEDLVSLLALTYSGELEETEKEKIPCTMMISKGSNIATPSYKNLDTWSLEDFLMLLDSIGPLLGIALN